MALSTSLKKATRSVLGKMGMELRADPLNNPSIPLSSAGFLAWALSGEPTASGEQINISTALQQITVYSCVRVLAESVASLPLKLYEIDGNGRTESVDQNIAYLLQVEPNDEMTAFTFWEAIVGSLALTGNGYAEIQRDAGGRVVALWPLNPQVTTPKRKLGGELIYETSQGVEGGNFREIKAANMLHIPLFSFDGLKGMSPIQLARQGIGLARASEKFGARFFGNGSRPGGVLSSDSKLNDVQMRATRETWQQTQAGDKQGSTAVLSGDWKYQSIGLSPEESQFLETRQFQRTEICALFRVPPNMVGDTSRLSNNNHEQMSLSFVTDTLRPYLNRIEGEVTRKLLPKIGRSSGRFQVRYDVTERLRGDFKTTMEGYATGRQWGWLTANNVLVDLGMNRGDKSLDVYMVPVNMQNSERLLDTESIQDQPIGGPVPAPTEPENEPTPQPEERSLLGEYTRNFVTIFRDGIGRLSQRNRRDYDTVSAIFEPVLGSIASLSCERNGLTEERSYSAVPVIADALKALEKRAAKWPEKMSPDEVEQAAQSEFLKAVRSLHINISREIAASKAAALLAKED